VEPACGAGTHARHHAPLRYGRNRGSIAELMLPKAVLEKMARRNLDRKPDQLAGRRP
jgi:hypothetical protein